MSDPIVPQRLKLARCPRSLAPTLVALPSMSRVPPAPFSFSAFQLSASDLCPLPSVLCPLLSALYFKRLPLPRFLL